MSPPEAPSPRARTLAAMAIGAVAISFAAIFFRRAGDVDPLLASAIRLGLAAVVLAPAAVRAASKRALPPVAVRAAVVAGFFYALHFGTWVASLSRTTIAASVTLVTATPLLSALLALVEGRDRPERRHGIAIVLALGGVALIAGDDLGHGRILGDLLALAGAAAMVGYLRVVRGLGGSLDALAFSAHAAAWGALFLVPVVAVSALSTPIVWPSEAAMGWLALSALVPQVVGHTLLTYALRRATPTEVGLATAAEPVLSTVLAWVVLTETPTEIVLAGCGLTLVGVVVGARPAPASVVTDSRTAA